MRDRRKQGIERGRLHSLGRHSVNLEPRTTRHFHSRRCGWSEVKLKYVVQYPLFLSTISFIPFLFLSIYMWFLTLHLLSPPICSCYEQVVVGTPHLQVHIWGFNSALRVLSTSPFCAKHGWAEWRTSVWRECRVRYGFPFLGRQLWYPIDSGSLGMYHIFPKPLFSFLLSPFSFLIFFISFPYFLCSL